MSTLSLFDGSSDGVVETDLKRGEKLYGRRSRQRSEPSFRAIESTSSTNEPSKQPVVVLFGVDISTLSPTVQFLLCAGGAFLFSIAYGYLQELLSVHVASRKYALFLAVCTFAGSAFWSFVLTRLRQTTMSASNKQENARKAMQPAPLSKFLVLSLVRACDLALTNMAMQYLNYPAKTLIKSSKVVFTMALGVLIQKHHYRVRDYSVVFTLVLGLAIFLHADHTSDAVFHPVGVVFLVLSLMGDGVINNYSEKLMESYSMTQDEYHTRLYSIALVATILAAHIRHELFEGIDVFLLQPGTVAEIESGSVEDTEWPVSRKALVLVLFSATGIFGASCLGAITKRFGALAMALTSTARKATTLFLSFLMFHNTCTPQHVFGVLLFIGALIVKSVGTKNKHKRRSADMTAAGMEGSSGVFSRSPSFSKSYDILGREVPRLPPPIPFGRRPSSQVPTRFSRHFSISDISIGGDDLAPAVTESTETAGYSSVDLTALELEPSSSSSSSLSSEQRVDF
jgi:adenosine 3'-phospho 5'-phosphosulfate transporter B3